MKYVRLAETHLPLAGGMLNQTASFIEAFDWITLERRRWKAELGIE